MLYEQIVTRCHDFQLDKCVLSNQQNSVGDKSEPAYDINQPIVFTIFNSTFQRAVSVELTPQDSELLAATLCQMYCTD